MSNITTIYKKELKTYFSSPIAYIYIIAFISVISWFFFRNFFLINQAQMRILFDLTPWVFLFLVPAISMRIWAEEKKSGTLDFLFTFPILDVELIISKFLASSTLLVLSILGTIPLILVVTALGEPDLGPIIMGYIGLLLLGMAFLSIGFFVSSLTENQIIAFIISVLLCFFAYILANDLVLQSIPWFLKPILQSLSLNTHYLSLSKGVLDLRDVVYYLSFIIFFLFLNWQVLDHRRVAG